MRKFLRSFILFLITSPVVFANTPPQFINKTCSANQFFNKIAPGPNNITCLQPTYSGISNTPTFADSVQISSNIVTLVNDLLSPGNSKYYGTDPSGVRGFFNVTTDVNTIGTFDSATPSANAAVISTNSIVFQSASVTVPGMVNNTTQSFSGNKTFSGTVGASNLSGTNTGDVSIGTADGLSLAGQVLSLALSSTSTTGALSSTDWNTFNGKQASGNYITALSGDVVATGPGAVSSTIQPGVVDNGKVSTSAAIAFSKLAPLSSANILVGNVSNVATSTAVTGDVTLSNGGVTAIGTNKVANSQLAQMAANTIKGNNTGLTANAADLTVAQTHTLLGDVTTLAAVGAVPNANGASISGNTLNLQAADGTNPGALTAGTQTIGGSKTFSAAPSFSSIVNTGTLTLPTATDTLVGRATTDTLTNKTLTSPVIGTIVNTGTLTLPTATDTLVGRATTDTLTNKTLTGNTAVNLVSGSGTLTLNTSGTVTLPNATDTLVGKATTDSLTNKTLDSSDTFSAIAVTLTTTGGTPSTLSYYEEGTFSAVFNQNAGASGSGTTFTVAFTRVGKVVTLLFPNMNGMTAGATNASFATAAATVPTRLRPVTAGMNLMAVGHVNGADVATPLQINIGTGGAISIFRDGTNSATFTSAAISGPYACAMTYTIQ